MAGGDSTVANADGKVDRSQVGRHPPLVIRFIPFSQSMGQSKSTISTDSSNPILTASTASKTLLTSASAPANTMSFLKVDGDRIVKDGKPIILRGAATGGHLNQEVIILSYHSAII